MITSGRASGILLHPTSLPGPHGSGDLGPDARRFVDWLAEAGQTLWQILPLNPPGPGNSPYMSPSVHAGNPLLISLEELARDGWLDRQAIDAAARSALRPQARIDFEAAGRLRMTMLRQAASRFFEDTTATDAIRREFHAWCESVRDWLDDYALFMAIAGAAGVNWVGWPARLRDRDPDALAEAATTLAAALRFWRFVQWTFDRQWTALRRYANDRGIAIVGDMPIFCDYDSVDVWCHPTLFQLDATRRRIAVAGVPPDYFSATGQLWGNPLYDWPAHEAQDYAWWRARMRTALRQADMVRIDHFRGLAAYWAVPAGAVDAVGGCWQTGPGRGLFDAIAADLVDVEAPGGADAADIRFLPIVAEDLGTITPDVIALRRGLGIPGMCVLQFAFRGGPDNLYLPHNLHRDCVLYTGTHDNDTTRGWFDSASTEERRRAQVYLKTDGHEIHWDLIHAASASVAERAIYPLQDVLGLGNEARMNLPGQALGQWGWRFDWSMVQPWYAQRLREIGLVHGRVPT